MRGKPSGFAVATGLTALLATFLAINVVGTLYASYDSPHDGQGGIGPFLVSLVAAPLVALLTFVTVLARARRS